MRSGFDLEDELSQDGFFHSAYHALNRSLTHAHLNTPSFIEVGSAAGNAAASSVIGVLPQELRASGWSGIIFVLVSVAVPCMFLCLMLYCSKARNYCKDDVATAHDPPGHCSESRSKEPDNTGIANDAAAIPAELARRLSQGSQGSDSTPAPIEVLCPDNVSRSLGWWTKDSISKHLKLVVAEANPVDMLPAPWSVPAIVSLLGNSNISTEKWSEKALKFLHEELSSSKARLLCQPKPMRAVELVLLFVEYVSENRVLQEIAGKDLMFDPVPEKTPCTRRMASESVLAAARRCLVEKVHIPEGMVKVHESLVNVIDTVEDTDHFQGLQSVVRKYVVHIEITSTDVGKLKTIGLPTGRHSVRGHMYEWLHAESAIGLMKHLHRKGGRKPSSSASSPRSRRPPRRGDSARKSLNRTVLDDEPRTLLPHTNDSVSEMLQVHCAGTSPDHEYERMLPQIVEQLSSGQISAGIRRSDERLVFVQDVVTLLVATCSGEVLAEDVQDFSISGSKNGNADARRARLPRALRLADEDAWAVARRISHRQLGIAPHELVILEQQVQEVQGPNRGVDCEQDMESPALAPSVFPPPGGPELLRREFIVRAEIPDSYEILDVLAAPATIGRQNSRGSATSSTRH